MNITKQELSKCICLIYKEVLAAPSYPLDVTVIEEAIHPLHTASPRIKKIRRLALSIAYIMI